MVVHGTDPATGGYRVRMTAQGGPLAGHVPGTPGAARLRRHDTHDWIDRHRARIEAAPADLAAGCTPPSPDDQLRLAED